MRLFNPFLHYLLIVLLSPIQEVLCAKVLFTVFHDRGSHFGSMLPLMEKLAQHGHSVSVVDTIHDKDRSPLLRHIRVRLPHVELVDEQIRAEFAEFFWNKTDSSVTLPEFYQHCDSLFETLMLNYPDKMVDLINEHWDLIVIDDLMWPFGYFFGTLKQRQWEDIDRMGKKPRLIIFSTAAQTLSSAESIRATGRNWVSRVPFCPYIPTDAKDMYQPARFTHRLFGFYENFAELVMLNWYTERFMMPNIANFGVPNFSWFELYQRTSLEFNNFIDRLGWPMAQGPEMVNLGSYCRKSSKNHSLPAEFARFMENPNSRGTILLTFGTYPDWAMAPPRILNALFGALRRLRDYRIIFTYNGPTVDDLGDHIMLTKWAPQLEILDHPSTLAFVTHGGLKGVNEGLCAGVPLIVMPLFAEQAHQAHLVLAMGIGPVINKYSLTADSVHKTIQKVVSDPGAVEKAQKFRRIYIDRPLEPLDEGLFHVERLLKSEKVGFPRKGMQLDWFTFAHLDLAFCIFGILLLISKK